MVVHAQGAARGGQKKDGGGLWRRAGDGDGRRPWTEARHAHHRARANAGGRVGSSGGGSAADQQPAGIRKRLSSAGCGSGSAGAAAAAARGWGSRYAAAAAARGWVSCDAASACCSCCCAAGCGQQCSSRGSSRNLWCEGRSRSASGRKACGRFQPCAHHLEHCGGGKACQQGGSAARRRVVMGAQARSSFLYSVLYDFAP